MVSSTTCLLTVVVVAAIVLGTAEAGDVDPWLDAAHLSVLKRDGTVLYDIDIIDGDDNNDDGTSASDSQFHMDMTPTAAQFNFTKCPHPSEIQNPWVRDNFDMKKFEGNYYELAFHDYTQYPTCLTGPRYAMEVCHAVVPIIANLVIRVLNLWSDASHPTRCSTQFSINSMTPSPSSV
eukprot:GFYU01003419.1.p1 GENE.GFYU01003419.1~~GFYU01003419.1.p1  ORF type:complete len:193 (-),score=32.59 GFYU01003419.1:293-826(-)